MFYLTTYSAQCVVDTRMFKRYVGSDKNKHDVFCVCGTR